MSLLLDTHSVLWFLLDDPRLGTRARDAIMTHPARVLVSPASLWEIAIKISLCKYGLPMDFTEFWDRQLAENHFTRPGVRKPLICRPPSTLQPPVRRLLGNSCPVSERCHQGTAD